MTEKTKENNEKLLSSTAKGASYLIFLQLLSRMLTFILHQIVLRYTTPETFGIASVKLELLLSTILFISREGYRCALIRGDTTNDTDDNNNKQQLKKGEPIPDDTMIGMEQKVMNLSYIPTLLGLLTTCLACGYYLTTIDDMLASLYPYYRLSVVLFGTAAFIELCIEPLFILALNKMYFQLRVTVEGTAVVLRCLFTFGLTLLGVMDQSSGSNNNPYCLLAFAVAQFAFGVTMAIGYSGFFLYKVKQKEISLSSLFPRKLKSVDGKVYWFDPTLKALGSTLTKQSLLKHVLTEGDKMLISALSTDADQGVYAFVVNYGSLVVRILFQPLEETGRTLFSKLLNKDESTTKKKEKENDHAISDESKSLAIDVLMVIIRFHVLLGLVFICFATNYTATLIDLLVGKRWSEGQDAPFVLSVYCMYVPIMGINGITEGFVQAVASKSDLQKLSYYMIGFSLCFMSAGCLFMYFLKLGAIGLILANMVNLGIRIYYSWHFISNYFKDHDQCHKLSIRHWVPNKLTLLAFSVSWIITYLSQLWIGWKTLKQKAIHICIGGLCFVIVCLIMYWKDRTFLNEIKRLTKVKHQ
ncbi:unnamed protein product [Cunninghamella blakesleeana]